MSKKRDISSVFLIIGVVFVVAIAAFWVIYPRLQPSVTLRIGDGVFHTKLILTEAAWRNELMSIRELDNTEARLMVHSTEGSWPVNSSRLGAAVDIVWLDKDKKVVYIVKNIQPNKMTNEVEFASKDDAKYVVLFAEGTVDARAIRAGKTAVFEDSYE